jgi:hypothetical protein
MKAYQDIGPSIKLFIFMLLLGGLPLLLVCCESSNSPRALISSRFEKRLSQVTNEEANLARAAAERGDEEAILTMIQWSFQNDKIEDVTHWQNALDRIRHP